MRLLSQSLQRSMSMSEATLRRSAAWSNLTSSGGVWLRPLWSSHTSRPGRRVSRLVSSHRDPLRRSFLVAASWNWWNRTWTFRAQRGNFGIQGMRFFIVSATVYGADVGVLATLVSLGSERLSPKRSRSSSSPRSTSSAANSGHSGADKAETDPSLAQRRPPLPIALGFGLRPIASGA